MEFNPHPYQKRAINHLIHHPCAALFMEMGLGKSSCTLTALQAMLDAQDILKPLIIAPKKVAEQTWSDEIDKWDHLQGMTISKIIGSQKKRLAALAKKADVYVISRDNIKWLVTLLKQNWDFDCVIIDELSSFKNSGSERFKALRKVRRFCQRVIGLTGTPAPNGLPDLWPQVYLLDMGIRLGHTKTGYLSQFFYAAQSDGHIVYKYALRPGAEEEIYRRIDDICLSMKAEDYLDLPKRIDIMRPVVLDNMREYEEFKKTELLKVAGTEITPVNAPGLYNKLLQFCNGSVYDEDGRSHTVNSSKLDAVIEAVEELNGSPVLIFYQFKPDLEKMLEALPGSVHLSDASQIKEWNAGKIPVLIAHPASAGHGLNLQEGGHHIFWFGVTWSLELYQQAVARLDRQGQKKAVVNVHFVGKDTIEEKVVMPRLADKHITQEKLIQALKKAWS